MSIPGLFFAVVMALLSLAVLLLPYMRRQSAQASNAVARSGLTRDALLATYERVLSAIRDLDDDFNTGKLAQDTYQAERSMWADRGVQVLKKLEEVDGAAAAPAKQSKSKRRVEAIPAAPAVATIVDEALDEAVEEAIAKYRKAKSGSAGV